jgi:soluble lytic murein transglycosylase-like protein
MSDWKSIGQTQQVSVLDFLEVGSAGLPPRLFRWKKEIAGASLGSGVCPLLIAAVMDRESRGEPDIIGSDGHGRGLMQIDDRFHKSFCTATLDGGAPLWKIPSFNLLYGAQFLAKLLKALDENQWAAVAAYNAGLGAVQKVLAKFAPIPSFDARATAVDAITTGGNYAFDVLRRRNNFLQLFN